MRVVLLWVLLAMLSPAQNALKTQIDSRPQTDPLSSGQQYVLGAGDQVVIRASNCEEISDKPFRIESDGNVTLPLLGKMNFAGRTSEQLESELTEKLSQYVRSPQVIVTIVGYRSEPVTFAGSFKAPGVYNLQGHHTLTEMLAIVGGLDPNASRILRITRAAKEGPISLPGSRLEANASTYVARLDISAVTSGQNPADTFILMPFDLVTALPGDPIYVSGEVVRVGPVLLGDRKSLTVAQVLNICGGLTKEGSKKIKVYRQIPDSSQKKETDLDLDKIQKGQEADLALQPTDLVVVPRANGRVVALKAATVATGILAGAVIATR